MLPTRYEAEKLLEEALRKAKINEYDRLIRLCDALAGQDGVVDIEERMKDVKHRYGSYPKQKWDANMALKQYFEEKTGSDIYKLLLLFLPCHNFQTFKHFAYSRYFQ